MHVLFMILGFMLWWPLGLVILGFLIARGRFSRRSDPSYAGEAPMMNWGQGGDRWSRKMSRLQGKMERMASRMDRARSTGDWFGPSSSGNHAFDDYRAETLKRLEDEQREFKDFLGRLRFAKDRAEFDQFMNERRERPSEPGPQAPPQG